MTLYEATHLTRPSSWDLPEEVYLDCGYDGSEQDADNSNPWSPEDDNEEDPQEGVQF